MRRLALLIVGLTALAIAGPEAIGRVFLRAGMPTLAAPLLKAPDEVGVARYRAGDFQMADAALAMAGRSQTFNRGLTLAATGNYPLSVAYFDAVLFTNPSDTEARHNRDLIATMYPPDRGTSVVPGRLKGDGGQGTGPQTLQTGAGQDPETHRQLNAKGMVASDDWLQSLPDDPGAFLKLRLRAEYARRAEQRLIRPREAEPW